MRYSSLVNILVLNLLFTVGAQIYLIGAVPAFGWDSLQFWLPQSHMTLAGVDSTEYRNGQWTHPQPRSLINLISVCKELNLPYQYIWFFASMSFWIAATRGMLKNPPTLIPYLAFTGTVLSTPLWESHIIIVGYADLLVAILFGFSLKFARSALADRSKKDLGIFALICSSLPFVKNTGSSYALLLIITFIQVRYLCTKPRLSVVTMLLVIIPIFLGPSIMEVLQPNFHFSYAGNDLVSGDHSGVDIAKNWWIALFNNMSFSILPALALVVIVYVLLEKDNLETYLPVFAIINIFYMLSISQWFDYGFIHALPGSDTGNSRFFLPVVSCLVFVIYDILTAYNLRAISK